jgi:hypothetical protein
VYFGLRPVLRQRWMGSHMKSAIADHLPYDNYVVRIDGRVKSHHRRFIDALREGLYLRDQFPRHDVKVGAMHQSGLQKVPVH